MRFTLAVIAVVMCWAGQAEGVVRHPSLEALNRRNRGVQTFESMTGGNPSEVNQEMATTLKPLPSTYTVVDWQRYYPFGSKFADGNRTEGETSTTTVAPEKRRPPGENLLYPVYIRVPIRVPLKAAFRKPEAPKMVIPRTVRGAKGLGYPHRYKIPPRFMMFRHQVPMRRKFVAYYPKPSYLYKRHPRYIKPVFLKTGLHDYYQKSVYYPLRGQGYAVTEPKAEWYDPGKVSENLV